MIDAGTQIRRIKRLRNSPTLRSILVYGASGAGFAGANLILAYVLPRREYALFTLVLALVNLAAPASPLGLDSLVLRRRMTIGGQILKRLLVAASIVTLGFILVGHFVYHLGPWLLLIVAVSSLSGGMMAVVGARLQSEQRFALALSLTQSPNVVLMVAAVAAFMAGWKMAWPALVISAIGYATAAIVGWGIVRKDPAYGRDSGGHFAWGEALALAGLDASGLLLLQLDRLVIPWLLPLNALALFGVLSAIAGSVFRVLQMGVGYALIPRLRAATGVVERRRLVRYDVLLVTGLMVLGAFAVAVAVPLVKHFLLHGKYDLRPPLVLAVVVSGIAKVLNAFAKALVAGLALPDEVNTVNLLGWLSVALAVAGATLGAHWGLAGVIYGVGLGWLVRALAAFRICARHLRLPEPVPAQ
jgi:O-antigen/teichoic acid export membrane protein